MNGKSNGQQASSAVQGQEASSGAGAVTSGASIVRMANSGTDETRLVWVDMEMTGLRLEIDRIIEIAVVITDGELNPVAEGPVLVIHQPDGVMDGMEEYYLSMSLMRRFIRLLRTSWLNFFLIPPRSYRFKLSLQLIA